MSRSGHPGKLTFSPRNDCRNRTRPPPALPYVDQGSRDYSDHVVQKAGRFDFDKNFAPGIRRLNMDFGIGYGTDGRKPRRSDRLKAGKVMRPNQFSRSQMHHIRIQDSLCEPCPLQRKRIVDSAWLHDVAITLGERIVDRVKSRRRFDCFPHHNIGRQCGVKGLPKDISGKRAAGIEADDLAEGVNPGIGSTAAGHVDRFLGDLSESLFQGRLN